MSNAAPRVSFVSLGCPKALVDLERIITRLRAEGYELTRKHDGADCVIVNTCGFLDSAKAESLEAIGQALKENGKVIVTGCMGAQPNEIRDTHPNVLAITGPQAYESVMEAVHAAVPPAHDPFVDLVPPEGIKLTPRHYAYLKISEGCSNRCSFCIIPSLRGDLVSRPAGDVLREAERLVNAGVKEILVISQDTSAYGIDLKYAESNWKRSDGEDTAGQSQVLRSCGSPWRIGRMGAVALCLPLPACRSGNQTDGGRQGPALSRHTLSARISECSQGDAPPAHQEKTLERIRKWREICPELAVRSTFIVGFPGETEEDFEMLLDWLTEAKLERVGCFKYEPVATAKANDLGLEMVPEDVKQNRWNRFMAHQQKISERLLRRRIGQRIKVIVDKSDGLRATGRSVWDAPEIDGAVHFTARRPVRVGDIVTVKIDSSDAYDLHGVAV